MRRPALLGRGRRVLAALLAVLAIVQAGVAALFAQAVNALLMPAQSSVQLLISVTALIVAGGAAVLAERYVAERFAQSFVADCRTALFDAVIRNAGDGGEARWLTSLVGDLTAIRNCAARGTVRLWTSAIVIGVTSTWFVIAVPEHRLALIPIAGALVLLVLCMVPLTRLIANQRRERGQLNRFLIRRVRIALSGQPVVHGHGRRKLATLSAGLRQRIEVRSAMVGVMEAIAVIAGTLAAVLLAGQAGNGASTAGIVGSLSIIGFLATRELELARALHAQAGGAIALRRLENLLGRQPRNIAPGEC